MLRANSFVLRGNPPIPWHHWEIEQVLSHLQSQREGLTYVVARQRLRRYGRNQVPTQRRIVQIVRQPLTTPFTYLLLAIAAVAQYVSGEGWYVLGLGIFHACIGMWLTARAIRAREAALLGTPDRDRSPAIEEARVRRDGQVVSISARDLVVGDIVEIQAGDRPSVDLRLFESEDLQTDRTGITSNARNGSMSIVDKQGQTALPLSTPAVERSNIVYAGTTVTSGRGVGVAIATGSSVYGYKIWRCEQPVSMMHDTLRRLRQIWFVGISIAIAILVRIFIDRGETDWYEISFLCLAIAIGTYPQNLLRIATLMQWVGIQNLAQKGLWVKFPSAIDALSHLSIITPILDSNLELSIDNLDRAGIKWHGLIRASQTDADALGKVLGIEVSSYFDRPLETIRLWQSGERIENQNVRHSRRASVAVVAEANDDIPLLRQADVGICARTAPQLVQNSAGLILPEAHFHYIPLAIAAGRSVVDPLQRIVWQIAISAVALVLLAIAAVYIKAAIVPLQIVWVGAIATPLLALVLMLDLTPTNIMTRHSKQFQSIWRSNYLHVGIAIATIAMTVGAVFWFKYQQSASGMLQEARTMAFTTLVFSQIFYTCSLVRSSVFSNIPLMAIAAFLAIAQVAIINLPEMGELFATTPLSWTEWAIASLAATSIFWVEEILTSN
ncbi:cation transporting ATPase C-terminal domain-containing protein [Pseudanabaena sp. PCC 6802]|uniref:cation transporting ATPase C-terminal domain-containing protein n=1 Tax=Pseudanabaena sp. PCC 6802 TaxID=118173 RepID=UPI000362142C|nr:cation transporting ATPase C-terminal domain-containing protein [Pseudanabaena sp. PCC 6802]